MATGTMRMTAPEQQQEKSPVSKLIEVRLTEEQEEYLERQFQKSKNPHPSEMMLTAAETGLLEEEVQAWFKHRMTRWRMEQGLSPVSGRVC